MKHRYDFGFIELEFYSSIVDVVYKVYKIYDEVIMEWRLYLRTRDII